MCGGSCPERSSRSPSEERQQRGRVSSACVPCVRGSVHSRARVFVYLTNPSTLALGCSFRKFSPLPCLVGGEERVRLASSGAGGYFAATHLPLCNDIVQRRTTLLESRGREECGCRVAGMGQGAPRCRSPLMYHIGCSSALVSIQWSPARMHGRRLWCQCQERGCRGPCGTSSCLGRRDGVQNVREVCLCFVSCQHFTRSCAFQKSLHILTSSFNNKRFDVEDAKNCLLNRSRCESA